MDSINLARSLAVGNAKRVLVYSHDTFGLGNIRRMLEISRHLVESDPDMSVLIITGSPMLHAFRLGFRHPVTGERVAAESPMPEDMKRVLAELRR